MRFVEFRQHEATRMLTEAKVGREYQHLEDLVIVNGSAGAVEAVDTLERLSRDTRDVAIKWDGNPTVYFGREPDGTFVLVGKNGWGRNKSTTPDDLENFIKTTGKGEDWRDKFGSDMANVFKIMKAAFPQDIVGYFYGDLLYHPGKMFDVTDSGYQFTPNKVTYTVDPSSELGEKVKQSKLGVVVHSKYTEFGSKDGEPIGDVSELSSPNVLVIGQRYVSHTPTISTDELVALRQLIKSTGDNIDAFLQEEKGLSDMRNILYTFVNSMSRANALSEIGVDQFFNWIKTSKVSQPKQARILEKYKQNPRALAQIFELVRRIMAEKNSIIDQLDSGQADVTASIDGQPGGEGYIAHKNKVKLVPRHRWKPN